MNIAQFTRPKLPRNKYGVVEDKNGSTGGTSIYGGGGTGSGGTVVEYDDFVGATNTQDGKRGLVPAPKCNTSEPLQLNDQVKFLKGSGGWTDIPISRYTTENANHDGIDLNGNLFVADTLTAMTLNVLGEAHFWELVIDKVKAAGGNLLISPASFRIDAIGDEVIYPVDASTSPYDQMFYNADNSTGIYGLQELFNIADIASLTARRLYMKNSDDSRQTISEVEIGDMIRCKTLNYDVSQGFANKDYWTFVMATGTATITVEDSSVDCLYIDVYRKFTTSQGISYGLGQWINQSGIVNPIEPPLPPQRETDVSKEVLLRKSDVELARTSEIYLAEDVRLESGTIISADIITPDGTKYVRTRVTTETIVLPKYTVVSLTLGNTLDCFTDDTLFTNGATALLIQMNEGKVNNVITTTTESPSAITQFRFGYGTFNPEVGDDLVVLGHLWDARRQAAILISSYDPMDTELKAPAIAQYQGIREFTSISKWRTTAIAANGNTFKASSFLINYNGNYIDINDRINIFYADLVTGLENVGIHIDGQNSTITMVGNIELRQNSDGEPDSLTVWDSSNIMRVKISPENLPSKADIQTAINPLTPLTWTTHTGNTVPTSSEVWTDYSYTYFLTWVWDESWKYYLKNAYFNYSLKKTIGTYQAGDHITFQNLRCNISTKAYFKGSTYTNKRGTQSISSVIVRLKRKLGLLNWITVDSWNITNSAAITSSSELATVRFPNGIFNSYEITTSGTYQIEVEIIYNVYAEITYTSQQSNPYFTFDYSVTCAGEIKQPSTAMTRIGANGLTFNSGAIGEYFYAGNDGMEMKWGDAGYSLDSSYGLTIYRKSYTCNTSGTSSNQYVYTPPLDCDILYVDGNYVTVDMRTTDVAEGREMIIVGKANGTTQLSHVSDSGAYIQIVEYDPEYGTPTYHNYNLIKKRWRLIFRNGTWYDI